MAVKDTRLYVYILESENDHRYYCGHTKNLGERLQYHNDGFNKSTKSRMPWKMIYYIDTNSRGEAMTLESRIKKRGIRRFLNDINAAV